MSELVVYESTYGNTRALADAGAEGIGGALPVRVAHAADVTMAGLERARACRCSLVRRTLGRTAGA